MARATALKEIGGVLAAVPGRSARRWLRDVRVMVPACIILICGSFAAATILQMRLDRAHALSQAMTFEQDRARDIALTAGATLDRYARQGILYADTLHPAVARAEPGIGDIIVFDPEGRPVSQLSGAALATRLPRFARERTLIPGGLALHDHGRTIAVLFQRDSLVPAGPMSRAALLSAAPPGTIASRVPGWPLVAVTEVDETGALASWHGALPLYLFVILGPALAGGWLAALFVGAFERHARAAHNLRALRALQPAEARLLVRLAQAERGASEALRSKSEFLAHMSHELRTPLNAIIGFSDIIAQGLFGPAGHPRYAEYANDIAESGRALHGKIGDILEFANIEAGRHPISLEAVDLAALTAGVIEEHRGRAFNRRIALKLRLGEPGLVRADPAALRRVLANLLANALTYTDEGGWVQADVRFEEGAGILLLRDSGAGFSAAELGKAGHAFQRFDRRGKTTGTGLGLAIAMGLTQRMGGAMRLAAGNQAAMELRLPKA